MDTKIDRTPRQLARDYYSGTLSFAAYREQRARLIDDIAGGSDPTRPVQQPAPAEQQPAGRHEPAPQDPPRPGVAPAPARGTGPWLLAVAGLAAAGALAGWLMLSGDGVERPLPDVAPDVRRAAGEGTDAQASTSSLLDDFLSANDWDQDAFTGLMLGWSALQEPEQQALRRSHSFRVFADRLRERVLEQRALRDIDSQAVRREQVLLSLAEHLDVPGLVFAPAAAATAAARDDVPPQPAAAPRNTTAPPVQAPEQREPGKPAAAARDTPAATAIAAAPPVATAPEKTDANAQAPAVSAPVTASTPRTATGAATNASVETAAEPQDERTEAPEPPAPVAAPPAETAAAARPDAADPCPATLAKTRRPSCSDTLRDGAKGPLMVVLPAGSFRMGSEREASEQPVREITFDRPFAISVYEVSVAEYRRFCKASARHCSFKWQRETDPAVNVSWKDAGSYTNWLSSMTGMNYRLPTEAEWEYAARARTTGDYPFNDGSKILPSDARFDADNPLTVDDRSVNANGFRLRHMLGNVREWVADAWFEDYQSMPRDGRSRSSAATSLRVVRGGSYADDAYRLRSSARDKLQVDARDIRTGFRLVREISH